MRPAKSTAATAKDFIFADDCVVYTGGSGRILGVEDEEVKMLLTRKGSPRRDDEMGEGEEVTVILRGWMNLMELEDARNGCV